MRPALFILPLVLLAACATPREQCISQATKDARIQSSLINEVRANIARGYALEQQQQVRTVRRTCVGRNEDGTTFTFRCEETDTVTVNVPVALDLGEDGRGADLRHARVAPDDRLHGVPAAQPGAAVAVDHHVVR